MKTSIKRIVVTIAIAALTTINIAAARHQRSPVGELRLDGNGNCACFPPGETSGPPCGGECLLGHSGKK
jgi:hypothetical protein